MNDFEFQWFYYWNYYLSWELNFNRDVIFTEVRWFVLKAWMRDIVQLGWIFVSIPEITIFKFIFRTKLSQVHLSSFLYLTFPAFCPITKLKTSTQSSIQEFDKVNCKTVLRFRQNENQDGFLSMIKIF